MFESRDFYDTAWYVYSTAITYLLIVGPGWFCFAIIVCSFVPSVSRQILFAFTERFKGVEKFGSAQLWGYTHRWLPRKGFPACRRTWDPRWIWPEQSGSWKGWDVGWGYVTAFVLVSLLVSVYDVFTPSSCTSVGLCLGMWNENRFSVLKAITGSTSSANDIEFIFFILPCDSCIAMRQDMPSCLWFYFASSHHLFSFEYWQGITW